MLEAISSTVARLGAPAMARVWRYDRALRRKLTPAGWLGAALLVASAVFGLNTRDSLIYQAFGLALGLLAVAALASWRFAPRLRVSRTLPRVATAGIAFDYTVAVENLDDVPHEALLVADVLEAPRPDRRAFARFKVREDRGRNVFDRLVGYPRWVAFMRMRLGAEIGPASLERLGPRAVRPLRLRCTPLRRGELRFAGIEVARAEPLGLMKASRRHAAPQTLLVMPRTHPVAPPQLPGARRLQPGGISFAGRVGDAEEFMSLRDYRPGDTPRRIHWKAWARTGRPVVKEHQDEFFVRHALILDTFPDGDAARFETAVSLAASHVLMPRGCDSLLDLVFVEGRAYTITQGRGVGASAELLRVLATLEAGRGTFQALAEATLLSAARVSGGICVLLQWDAPRRALVARLRALGIPLRVWIVRDEDDEAPLDPGPMAPDPRNFRSVHAGTLAAQLARP